MSVEIKAKLLKEFIDDDNLFLDRNGGELVLEGLTILRDNGKPFDSDRFISTLHDDELLLVTGGELVSSSGSRYSLVDLLQKFVVSAYCYKNRVYEEMEAIEYIAGESPPLMCYETGRVIGGLKDVILYAAENRLNTTKIKLVYCKPRYFHELCPFRTFGLAEEGNGEPNTDFLPEEIRDAFLKLNEAIGDKKHPFTWLRGNTRPLIDWKSDV